MCTFIFACLCNYFCVISSERLSEKYIYLNFRITEKFVRISSPMKKDESTCFSIVGCLSFGTNDILG